MAYYLDLFSPETFDAFGRSDRTISGFRPRQRNLAGRIKQRDKLVCYMTRLSRWVGQLEVMEGPFHAIDAETEAARRWSDPWGDGAPLTARMMLQRARDAKFTVSLPPTQESPDRAGNHGAPGHEE